MKKLFVNGGIALIAAMCVLAFAACPDTATGPKSPSNNAGITNVTIGAGEPVSPPLSSGNAAIDSVISESYELPIANMSDSVTLQLTRNNAGQTISWAKVGTDVYDAPADSDFTPFAAPASGNVLSAVVGTDGLANGEKIYIKVAAADKKTVLYYGFVINVGNIARLAALSLAGTAVTMWGEPGADWNYIDAVGAFYRDEPPVEGFALAASAEDGGTIAYAVMNDGDAEPSFTDLSGTPNVTLASGSILYIKVTSANESETAVYRINIFMKVSATVLYGQPVISQGTDGDAPSLDPLWDTITEWPFSINRINLAEQTPEYRFLYTGGGDHYNEIGYGHTEGKAKAFWDDFGLYVYAEMTFHNYREWSETAPPYPKTREIVVTPASGEAADSEANLYDSLEVFTNERTQQYTEGNYGIQYRVAPSPEGESVAGTNSRVSGNAPGDSSAITTFRNSGKYYTWTWIRTWTDPEDGEEKELSGYSVIAFIPWAFKTDTNANQVFGSDGKVITSGNDTGPTIGMEFQINAVTEGGSRDAVLAWNGVTGRSYQEVKNYGAVTLITGDLTGRGIIYGARDGESP